MSATSQTDTILAEDRNLLLLILGTCMAAGVIYQWQLWSLNGNGFSLLSERLPYWDFSNLWAGGYLARHGQAATLFDVEAYRSSLRDMFGETLPNQEWSYPPSLLLIGVPLSLLPIRIAYLVWSIGTLSCLYCCLRIMCFSRRTALVLSLCPAEMMNLLFGQNGALTAALLMGSLSLVPKRHIIAGILAGLLTIKPHLGFILPFCLIAGGHWRACVTAALTAGALAVATGISFGFSVWPLFLHETGALMAGIMEADFLQPYQKNAMTFFITARWLGAGVTAAYVVQGLVAAMAAIAAFHLWRPNAHIDHRLRVTLSAALTLMATPYGYSYDAVPVCVAVAALFFRSDLKLPRWLLGLTYLWPAFLHIANGQKLAIGILPPALLIGLVLGQIWFRRRQPSAPTEMESPLKAL